MQTPTKRKILIAAGALTLVGSLAGVLTQQPSVSGHATAGGVRAQNVDLASPSTDPNRSGHSNNGEVANSNTNGGKDGHGAGKGAGIGDPAPVATSQPIAPAPSSTPTPQPTPTPTPVDNSITLRVKNFGAFVGQVCLIDSPKLNDCTGDIDVGQPPTELHSTFLVPSDRPSTAQIEGVAQLGDSTTLDIPTAEHVQCFRFDGTTLIGFSFKKVDCNGF